MNSTKLLNKMDTIFMNSENSKTSETYILLLNLSDKINLKRSDTYVALSNLSIYYTWKIIKVIQKNKFKISTPASNEEFELPNGSYSASDIQDCFEYIIKKQKTFTCNPPVILVNKIKNRITFSIKTRYYFQLLTPESITLLGNNKSKITLYF